MDTRWSNFFNDIPNFVANWVDLPNKFFLGIFSRIYQPSFRPSEFLVHDFHHSDVFSTKNFKVHIFWEGQKILRNLHRRFDRYYIGQIYGGGFAKFCGLIRIYELYISDLTQIYPKNGIGQKEFRKYQLWVRSRWLKQRHSSFWFIVVDRIFVTHRSKKHLWIMRCRLFIVSDMWQKCDTSIIHTYVSMYIINEYQWVTRDVGNHAHMSK